MRVEPTAEGAVAPPKPRKRKHLRQYYEDNKVAIIADYQAMGLRVFLKKWKQSTSNWAALKREWEVPGKARGGRMFGTRPAKEPAGDILQTTRDPDRDHYMMLLGYQQAVRDILKIPPG